MDRSPSTVFSVVLHNGKEISGSGRKTMKKIRTLLMAEPPGSIVQVMFENSWTHRRNPGGVGVRYYRCNPRSLRRVAAPRRFLQL